MSYNYFCLGTTQHRQHMQAKQQAQHINGVRNASTVLPQPVTAITTTHTTALTHKTTLTLTHEPPTHPPPLHLHQLLPRAAGSPGLHQPRQAKVDRNGGHHVVPCLQRLQPTPHTFQLQHSRRHSLGGRVSCPHAGPRHALGRNDCRQQERGEAAERCGQPSKCTSDTTTRAKTSSVHNTTVLARHWIMHPLLPGHMQNGFSRQQQAGTHLHTARQPAGVVAALALPSVSAQAPSTSRWHS